MLAGEAAHPMLTKDFENIFDDDVVSLGAGVEAFISESWTVLLEDSEAATTFRSLLTYLYQQKKEMFAVYKSRALELIPVRHPSSANKYFNIGKDKGWYAETPDNIDKRRVKVEMTTEMMDVLRDFFTEISFYIIYNTFRADKKIKEKFPSWDLSMIEDVRHSGIGPNMIGRTTLRVRKNFDKLGFSAAEILRPR